MNIFNSRDVMFNEFEMPWIKHKDDKLWESETKKNFGMR